MSLTVTLLYNNPKFRFLDNNNNGRFLLVRLFSKLLKYFMNHYSMFPQCIFTPEHPIA